MRPSSDEICAPCNGWNCAVTDVFFKGLPASEFQERLATTGSS